jgi:hypothetical protein
MTDILSLAPQEAGQKVSTTGLPGATGYHIRCRHCDALTICPIEQDAPRIVCSGCNRLLMVPVTVSATCPSCQSKGTYPNTRAGHSAACATCGRTITVNAVVGVAVERAAPHHHRHAVRSRHGVTRQREALGYFLIILATASLATMFVLWMGL